MRSHYPRCLWSVFQPKNLSPKTLKQYLNFDLGYDSMNTHTRFSSKATFLTTISFDSIMFLTKYKWMSMCSVLLWYTWWFSKSDTLAITMYLHTYLSHSYLTNNPFNHMDSFTPSTRALCSAWVVDRATTECWFFPANIRAIYIKPKHDKDFLVSKLCTKCIFTFPFKTSSSWVALCI